MQKSLSLLQLRQSRTLCVTIKKLKTNTYLELFNPKKNNFFAVRILKNTENGYNALILENNKEIEVYEYQLKTYGYRNIWISDEIMSKLEFKKNGCKNLLNGLVVFEGLIGDLKEIEYKFHLFEFKSKHLGFAILKNEELKKFEEEFNKIEFNDKTYPIKEKYLFSNNINDLFSKLIETNPDKFNYNLFDKIVLKNI